MNGGPPAPRVRTGGRTVSPADLVRESQSRFGRRVEPVEPPAGFTGLGRGAAQHRAPVLPRMLRCPEPGRLAAGTCGHPGRPAYQGTRPGVSRVRETSPHATVEARTASPPGHYGPGAMSAADALSEMGDGDEYRQTGNGEHGIRAQAARGKAGWIRRVPGIGRVFYPASDRATGGNDGTDNAARTPRDHRGARPGARVARGPAGAPGHPEAGGRSCRRPCRLAPDGGAGAAGLPLGPGS